MIGDVMDMMESLEIWWELNTPNVKQLDFVPGSCPNPALSAAKQVCCSIMAAPAS